MNQIFLKLRAIVFSKVSKQLLCGFLAALLMVNQLATSALAAWDGQGSTGGCHHCRRIVSFEPLLQLKKEGSIINVGVRR